MGLPRDYFFQPRGSPAACVSNSVPPGIPSSQSPCWSIYSGAIKHQTICAAAARMAKWPKTRYVTARPVNLMEKLANISFTKVTKHW